MTSGDGRTLSWNADNRLASVTDGASGETTTFTYGGDGALVKKTAGSVTTVYQGQHWEKNLATGKVEITSQNHGFAVDMESLSADEVEVTHINLNDNTVEGIRHRRLPAFAVQYHPEASPGPHDSTYLFDDFLTLMEKKRW